jgi:hypothetical protein
MGEAHLFTSHSQGTAKDPLDQKTKIGYLHSITSASTQIHGSSKEEPTIFHAATKLYKQGHKHLVVVAGSDRVEDFQKNLEKYNDGKQYPHGSYKFKSIKVVSAGQRDPDAEGIEGMYSSDFASELSPIWVTRLVESLNPLTCILFCGIVSFRRRCSTPDIL